MKWRRVAFALAAIALSASAARGPALEALGRFLVKEDPPVKADAVVVLAGSFPDRILEAAALYEEGLAPLIVLCREPEGRAMKRLRERGVPSMSLTDRNRDTVLQLGVPASAVQVIDRAGGSTFGEANEVLRHLETHGIHSILLVTSKFHTRRAGWIYRQLAEGRIRISVRGARDDGYGPDGWWHNRVSTRRLVIEYQKILVYLLVDEWRHEPAISS